MPTYEYECSNGHRFEVVQPITEDPLERCQDCSAQVRRLISAAAFILKGGGWYSDGYGSSSSKSSAKADAKGSADGGASEGSSKSSSDTSSKDSKSSSSGASSESS